MTTSRNLLAEVPLCMPGIGSKHSLKTKRERS
jgi:hypothetical protein